MMSRSQAHVATDKAERFGAQLCKHFAHKIPAVFEGTEGRIEFAMGVCLLEASPDFLTLRVEADDAEKRSQVEEVVKSHLERFMWKGPAEITWNHD
jgi:hypothetical protein